MDQSAFSAIETAFNEIITSIGDWLHAHGLQTLFIILAAWIIKRFGTQLIMQILQKTVRADIYPTKNDRSKRIKTLNGLISAVLQVTVFVIAAIMIASELGLNTAPLIASAGIIGVALGFGAQSLIKDLTSGIFIIIENQYRVGDVIELDNGVAGKVEAITIRTTLVRTLDGTLYHVPNGNIGWTANKTTSYGGIEEDIVFSSDVDIEKLTIVINRTGEILAKNPEFSKKIQEAPHFEGVVGFDPNGIKVKIVGKTGSDDAWEVKREFYKVLIKELRKAKIEIPHFHVTLTNSAGISAQAD